MVRYCYVCNKKQDKNKDLCLHKFPKNREICLKWKQFCGLREVDDVSAIYICSFHFRPEDFRSHTSTLAAKKQLLKLEAVPSNRFKKKQTLIVKNAKLLLTKESSKVNKDETVLEKPQLEVLRHNKEYIEPEINVPFSYSSENRVKDYLSSVNMPANVSRLVQELLHLTPIRREHVETSNISELQSQIQNNYDENVAPEINVPFSYSSVKSETTEVVSPLQDKSSLHNVLANISKRSVNNLCSTPKRRRYAEPRYITEITTPDVQTPKRASRVIKFVKNNHMKEKEYIKKLQRKNRDLIKRIKTLENMVSHLKKMNLISEDAGDSLLVQYSV